MQSGLSVWGGFFCSLSQAGDYNANAHIAYEDDDTYMEDEGGGGGEQME